MFLDLFSMNHEPRGDTALLEWRFLLIHIRPAAPGVAGGWNVQSIVGNVVLGNENTTSVLWGAM